MTAIEITVHDRTTTPTTAIGPTPTADDPGEPAQNATPETSPAPEDHPVDDPGGRMALMLAILRSRPDETWHARDVARALSITNINSFRVQMSQWAHRGLIHKTAPATYTLAS